MSKQNSKKIISDESDEELETPKQLFRLIRNMTLQEMLNAIEINKRISKKKSLP